MAWLLPLLCTVLFYGLAQGIYKQVPLSAGHFCLLLVLAKTFLNWGSFLGFGPRPLVPPRGRRFLAVALVGQGVNGLAWIGYFLALDRGPAALVGTITAAYTAVAVVLAVLFLGERLWPAQAVGVGLVVLAGALLGYSTGDPATAGATGEGWLALSLLTLCGWGVAVCIFKYAYGLPGADDHRFFVTNWAGMGLTLLPYGLLSAHGAAFNPSALLLGLVIVLFYAIGDLTLFRAIRLGPAALVSPLSGLYPLPTLVYSALVLHERITPIQWLATVLVLCAIVLIVRGHREDLT
jgi:drug/metabolite transporter (DMT)-like permease